MDFSCELEEMSRGKTNISDICKGQNYPNIQDIAPPPEANFSIKKMYWAEAEITYKIKNFK